MSNISSWSTSSAANNAVSPDGFPEGMAPSGVNDSAREVMGAIKRWYVDAEWRFFEYAFVRHSNNSFLVAVTATNVFTAGRRLRLIDAGATIYGDVIASSMSGANTLVTVSSSTLSSSLSSGSVAIIDPAQTSLPFMNALTSTASVTASDYLEVWQSGTGFRRRALRADVVRGGALTLGTEQASTAGTSIDFTSIPDWVKRIVIMLVGVSTSGTSSLQVQLGDSGGVETTGYAGTCIGLIGGSATNALYVSGFLLSTAQVAAGLYSGSFTLNLEDSTDNTWVAQGVLGRSDTTAAGWATGGSKPLSAVLDRVRITTTGGADTFDAGVINILYEG